MEKSNNSIIDSATSNKDDAIPLFISFCIEQYKNMAQVSGAHAINEFIKYGIYDYLEKNFEILHSQSPQWILEEINELLKYRKA